MCIFRANFCFKIYLENTVFFLGILFLEGKCAKIFQITSAEGIMRFFPSFPGYHCQSLSLSFVVIIINVFPKYHIFLQIACEIIMPKSLRPPLAPSRQSFWQQQPPLWLQHFCHVCNFSLSLSVKQRAIHLDKMNKKKHLAHI